MRKSLIHIKIALSWEEKVVKQNICTYRIHFSFTLNDFITFQDKIFFPVKAGKISNIFQIGLITLLRPSVPNCVRIKRFPLSLPRASSGTYRNVYRANEKQLLHTFVSLELWFPCFFETWKSSLKHCVPGARIEKSSDIGFSKIS